MTHVTTIAKENTSVTGRRFTGPRRELNGGSPDLAGSKRLPKLTTSSPLLLFTGEQIPHSPSMHHHHLISNHRRASIEQFESSSVTSST
ncbi:hypothetical protein Bca4012_070577 [Brassica carinata]|uniref:Uncharacterized protein n=1 Tax=Brassica carinata TaxID=52824 RepID=A0A8X7QDB5_BRACI|nr:hypothetical protein Bca52824_062864 [Brassica carinata]